MDQDPNNLLQIAIRQEDLEFLPIKPYRSKGGAPYPYCQFLLFLYGIQQLGTSSSCVPLK